MQTIRIGAGAGYAGDRIEPAVELVDHGEIDYLVFECLAERTIALAQQERDRDPARGYDPLLEQRMRAVLGGCYQRGIRIITNAGAANPVAAASCVRDVARDLGLHGLKVAAVTGDDVLQLVRESNAALQETGTDSADSARPGSASPAATIGEMGDRILSANAYVGATSIVDALAGGAHVVITGRAADSSLFLAPLMREFGWRADDWTHVARGAVVGHLLECAGQITGGYFADPGFKDVPDLARLGFPIGEVSEDGSVVITKVAGSGGAVTARTCKEQLLYEMHDPSAYVTPDVVVDISRVTVREIGEHRVLVQGAEGRPRPESLKVSVGYRDSFVGEGQISYAGPGAVARARLALDIVAERLRVTGVAIEEARFELIGIDALHGGVLPTRSGEPYEVRARVVARTGSMRDAVRVGNEVETLYTNGPAGGGGVTKSAREVIAVASTYVPRVDVATEVTYLEA